LAWSAAIAALPDVIEGISKVISNINNLSTKTLTPKNQLQEQNKQLSKALEDLKNSVQKIGISIRDYEDIYSVAIKEETTAEALMDTFSVWKSGKQGPDDLSIPNGFGKLKNLDTALRNAFDAHKEEIEDKDREKINDIRSDIQDIFTSAKGNLKANTEASWNDACDEISKIYEKLGNISSVLKAHFNTMSTELIQTTPKTKTTR
jgi:hypothetical protein